MSFPEARPNKASGKGPCCGAVGRRSAPALKNNRKHMWRATGRDSRPTEQPRTRILGLRPDLTLLVPTDTSLSATLGQRSGQRDRQQISVLSSATGSSLHRHRVRDGRIEREGMMDVFVLSMAWALCGVVMLT